MAEVLPLYPDAWPRSPCGCRLVRTGWAFRTLTRREEEVIALICEGLSQKEVAFELGVADSTVRVLLSRAARKLGHRPGRACRLPDGSMRRGVSSPVMSLHLP